MDRGVIDAFEFNNPTSDLRFGARTWQRTTCSAHTIRRASPFEFIFNKDRFDSLDPDLQAILQFGVEAMGLANNALAMNQYSTDLQAIDRRRRQCEAHAAIDPRGAACSLGSVIPTLEADEFNKRVLDSQRAWVERVGFYQIMNAPSYQLAYEHYYPGQDPRLIFCVDAGRAL